MPAAAGRAETVDVDDEIAGWNETRTIPRDEVRREGGRERPFDVLNGDDDGPTNGGSNSFSLNWALKALKESCRRRRRRRWQLNAE